MKIFGLVLFGLVLSEVVLQLICAIYPAANDLIFLSRDQTPLTISGGPLGHQGNPERYDHDVRGYRNVAALETAEIVAIGDSHTYGGGVRRERAWPFLVQEATGLKTYNMGLGGYGPAHYLLQLDQAMDMKPKLVIFGIYFGNDFHDSFRLAMTNESIGRFLTEEELATIYELEEASALSDITSELFQGGQSESEDKVNESDSLQVAVYRWRLFLSERSALYGIARAVKNLMLPESTILSSDFAAAKAALSKEQLKYSSVFEDDRSGWRTIFTSPHRGLVNNRLDPRIDIGYGITFDVLLAAHQRTAESDVELLVILLPTKESVFSGVVDDPNEHLGYKELVNDEKRNREELVQYMRQHRIDFIDLLPILMSQVDQSYFESADGHPNMRGHEVISGAVIGRVRDKFDLPLPP
jgi:hypothetical protein